MSKVGIKVLSTIKINDSISDGIRYRISWLATTIAMDKELFTLLFVPFDKAI